MKRLTLEIMARLSSLRSEDDGASLLEYALLVALIALISILAVTLVGQKTLSNAASVLPALG